MLRIYRFKYIKMKIELRKETRNCLLIRGDVPKEKEKDEREKWGVTREIWE